MKDFDKLIETCLSELDKTGIKYGNVTKWEINTRAKKRWGQCRILPNGKSFEISISKRLLDDALPDESAKSTIIHELLHTCKGCRNHGSEWKKLASVVNSELGYNIKRCTSPAEQGIFGEKAVKQAKYAVMCLKCGKIYERERKSGLIKNPHRYRCGICGGKLGAMFPTDDKKS